MTLGSIHSYLTKFKSKTHIKSLNTDNLKLGVMERIGKRKFIQDSVSWA